MTSNNDIQYSSISSYLGIFNMNSAKYIAGLRLAYIVAQIDKTKNKLDILRPILMDTEVFNEYNNENDMICYELRDLGYKINIGFKNLNVPIEDLDEFSYTIISSEEIELFKLIYTEFISKAINCYKKGKFTYNVRLKIDKKYLKKVYSEHDNMTTIIDHYVKNLYAFFRYNGFCYVNMYVERNFFNQIITCFEVGTTV